MGFKGLALFSAFMAISVLHLAPTVSQEVEDEREFSYDVRTEVGPERWGLIHKEWEACSKGWMQSPIDLSDREVAVLYRNGGLYTTYRPSRSTMVNRGHDIMLKFEDRAGGLWLNGREHVLKQLHWHSPSEHTLNGYRFALELHMVHENADKSIAVIGILYDIGRPDPFLAEMEGYVHGIENIEHDQEAAGVVDPRPITWGDKEFYRYIGSLTAPPCTEGVVWTIMRKVRAVSMEQVRLLREAVNDDMEMNARPLQPTNGRIVRLYFPRKTGY